jgi:hypothetical protein
MPWCVPGLTSEKSRPLGDQKSCLSLGSIPYIAIWIGVSWPSFLSAALPTFTV